VGSVAVIGPAWTSANSDLVHRAGSAEQEEAPSRGARRPRRLSVAVVTVGTTQQFARPPSRVRLPSWC
jgi:hypothetical protein